MLRDSGYAGGFAGKAMGKNEPLAIDAPQELTAAERERANRRIEVRSITGAPTLSCARSED